jgi:hypothetical protein
MTINLKELFDKFGQHFACRVSYKGQKESVEYDDAKFVNWKRVAAVTVLFKNPKRYNNDGDTAYRDGVRFEIKI